MLLGHGQTGGGCMESTIKNAIMMNYLNDLNLDVFYFPFVCSSINLIHFQAELMSVTVNVGTLKAP